jgi:hypothetical protein
MIAVDERTEVGDVFADGDGWLWRVVEVEGDQAVLEGIDGRLGEREVATVKPDGSLDHPRDFSRVEVPVCEHGYPKGQCHKIDCPHVADGSNDGESPDSYRDTFPADTRRFRDDETGV